MAEVKVIKAQSRKTVGTGSARALRREGFTPAVIYGADMKDPVSVALSSYDLMMTMKKGGFFTNAQTLDIDGKEFKVLPRDLQRHPVSSQVIHVDFMKFDPKREVHVMVKVTIVDEDICPGAKIGGVLNILRNEVELICRADSIPNSIEISVAGLEIGGSAKMSTVTLPEGVKSADERDITLVNVLATRTSTLADNGDAEEVEGEETEEGTEEKAAE